MSDEKNVRVKTQTSSVKDQIKHCTLPPPPPPSPNGVLLKTDFHSRTSLDDSEISVIKTLKNKSNSKFVHLISANVVTIGNLPYQVLVEGF